MNFGMARNQILVGYNPKAKEYSCYNKKSGHIYSTCHVHFLESHKGHLPPTSVDLHSMLTDSVTLDKIHNESITNPIIFEDDKDFNFIPPIHVDLMDECPDNIIP